MHDVLEGHGGHGDHAESPFTMPVTVTLSILRVLLAICTLLGYRSTKEELLLATQEADQVVVFPGEEQRVARDADGRGHARQLKPRSTKEQAVKLREKYLKEAERYSEEKEEAKKEAEN